VGQQTAAALVNLFARVPFTSAESVVAYVGFDPRPNDSGTRTGRRHITKRGPSELRRLLYLVAQAAGRSRALKPVYQAIRDKGFSTTQALVILARRLLRVAFTIWKTGQRYETQRLSPSAPTA
jgi:transposase